MEERHTDGGHQACVGPGTSWAPQGYFVSVPEQAKLYMQKGESCLCGFPPKVLESSAQFPRRPK